MNQRQDRGPVIVIVLAFGMALAAAFTAMDETNELPTRIIAGVGVGIALGVALAASAMVGKWHRPPTPRPPARRSVARPPRGGDSGGDDGGDS
jgi:hypothetical protein